MIQEKCKASRGRRSQVNTAFRKWREDQGLTLRELAVRINDVEPSLAPDHGSVQHVEQNGSYDVRWVRGLSSALLVSESQVEAETRRIRSM